MRTTVCVFPFDQFGGAGTGAGAELLGDAVREILDDTDAETRPCRADCLRNRVEIKEFAFNTPARLADWRTTGRQAARKSLSAGDFLLWLGGNHLGVLPVLEELGADTLVVQFDAHLDLYSFHDNTPELSHGNFLRHFETPRPRLVNAGHRDLFLTPAEIAATFEAAHSALDCARDLDRVARELESLAAGAKRIWIDLDCDALDPTHLPAVQLPLPFGLAPAALLRLLDAVWSNCVLGISMSEFDPGRDERDQSLNLLGWLVEFVLLKVHEAR
jgi:arginase family enzyme